MFENGDLSESTKVREIVPEEERKIVGVSIVLNRTDDVPVELKPIVISNVPIVNQPAANVGIPLKVSKKPGRL